MGVTLFATGDLHVCARPSLAGMRPTHASSGEPLYLSHARETLAWIAREVRTAQGPVVVLVGGDLFDTPLPSPAAIEVVMRWLVELVGEPNVAVYLLLGNHDRESGSDRAHALAPLRHLRPGRITVVDRPGPVRIAPDAVLYPVPYPSRSQIAQWPGADSAEATNEAISLALNAIVEGYAAQAEASGAVSILWGHGTLGGASFGARTVPLSDPQVDSALQTRFDLSLWSHIHLRQRIGPQAEPAGSFRGYIGAPDRFDFGEAEQPAGVLRASWQAGRELTVTFTENPAARSWLTFDADQVAGEAWQRWARATVEADLQAELGGGAGRRTVMRVVGEVTPELAAQVHTAVRSLKTAGALIVDRTEVMRANRARVDVGADFNTSTVLEAVFEARPDLAQHANTIRGHVAALESEHGHV